MTTFAWIASGTGLAFMWWLWQLTKQARLVEWNPPILVVVPDRALEEDALVAELDAIYDAPVYEGVRP